MQDGVNILGVNYGSLAVCQYPRQYKLVSNNYFHLKKNSLIYGIGEMTSESDPNRLAEIRSLQHDTVHFIQTLMLLTTYSFLEIISLKAAS